MIDKEQEANLALLKDKETPSIGGTTAATIFMESIGEKPPFGKSAFGEWLRLTGRKDPFEPAKSNEEESRLEMGRLMEQPTAIRFQRRTGLSVVECPQVVHPSHSWATGHIDRIVVERPADLEIKTAAYPSDDWSDPNSREAQRVPLAYFLQPVWYAGIPRDHPPPKASALGAFEREIYIAAQFGHQPLRIYHWDCDEKVKSIYRMMFEANQKFWEEYVCKDVPPPMSTVDSEAAKQWLRYRYPKNENDEIVVAKAEVVDIAEAYIEAKRKADEASAEVERLKAKISQAIGNNYGIRATARGLVMQASWPTVKETRATDYEEVLRRLNVPVPAQLLIDCEKVVRSSYRRLIVTVKNDKTT